MITSIDWKEIKDSPRNSIKRKLICKNEGKIKTFSDKTMRIHHKKNCTEVCRIYSMQKEKDQKGWNERKA